MRPSQMITYRTNYYFLVLNLLNMKPIGTESELVALLFPSFVSRVRIACFQLYREVESNLRLTIPLHRISKR